jgi:hypothetical protein
MQRVINFSGGKTSAYLTIHEYKPGDIVLFCDTGREHEKTYKFIHDFEAFEGIPVVWLMINEYWRNKPYQLEIPSILGNCDLCFMKGKNALIAIMANYPELADKWIADEDRSRQRKEGKKRIGHTYFEGVTIRQLRNIAQNNLFKDYDLNEISPAFDCACTA